MKIQKYIKDKQNKYRVVIDDEEYITVQSPKGDL